MASGFPPTPAYPKGYDSDSTLFLVFNTSETVTTDDNAPWSEEITIKPVAGDEIEIWPENGFANISGELFYYDRVEKNAAGKIYKFKRCARNLGGTKTKHNLAGAEVRGFVVAEHHNQLVDAILRVENFVGENFTDERATLDWRIRNLSAVSPIFDDFSCPDLTFEFVVLSSDPATGTVARYNIIIDGQFTSYRLDFGDGEFTTSTTSGTHRYSANSIIDPVVTISNSKCTLIQSPIERTTATEPSVSEPIEVFEITIPTIPTIPQFVIPDFLPPSNAFNIPPIVFPCLDIGTVGPIDIPSVIVIDPPLNIPSIVVVTTVNSGGTLVPINIPSVITITAPNIPSLIEVTADIPTLIEISPININIPSIIEFGEVVIPTLIEFGDAPSFPTLIEFADAPSFPTLITFGDAPAFPTLITFADAPFIPTHITFGDADFPTVIEFAENPLPTEITFGPSGVPTLIEFVCCEIPTLITFGNAPYIPTHITFGDAPYIPTHITFGDAPYIPTHITFGAVNIPTHITFGDVYIPTLIEVYGDVYIPSLIEFGEEPYIPTLIEFGEAPYIPTHITFGAVSIPTHITFGSVTIPTHITFDAVTIPTHITFGEVSIPTLISFGAVPSMIVEWSTPPSLIVSWSTPPSLVCTVEVVCPEASPLRMRSGKRARNRKVSNTFQDGFDPIIDPIVEANALGIPSEIKISMPDIPDVKILHDIPTEIKVAVPMIPDIKVTGWDKMPRRIKLVPSEELPKSIILDATSVPKAITLDASSVPTVIRLEPGANFPTVITVDASGIPEKIQVVGIPPAIELIGHIPTEIKMTFPDKMPEMELVYKGAPIEVKIQLDTSKLTGDSETTQCVTIVPCVPRQ